MVSCSSAEENAEGSEYAEISFHGLLRSPLKVPILRGTDCGKDDIFLDIRNVGDDNHGIFFYDPGFTSTASCTSAITFIDGPGGKCSYRGIPVVSLARESCYLETCYLILYGQLPTSAQFRNFQVLVEQHMMVHEKFKEFFKGFQAGAHPMAIMVAVIGALSAFYEHGNDWKIAREERNLIAIRMTSKFPTLAAMAYKTAIGEPIIYPSANLSFAENFLNMMFSTPMKLYKANPLFVRALDVFLILHADHEQNASTATVRIAGSSQANPYACIAAGIASLWGPAHGGANQAVVEMLEEIGDEKKIPGFIQEVKRKERRLMGFGHRIYKNFDPRAIFMRDLTLEILSYKSKEFCEDERKMFNLAMALEKAALDDEYFVSRKLYPNVDFYSGILLKAIGVPISMFTVLFAMARSIGWISHWLEMSLDDKHAKIGRPRQIYVGEKERPYIKMGGRNE